MVIARPMHKGTELAEDRDVAMGWQPFGFRLTKVCDKDDFGQNGCRSAQNPQSACLDQS